MREEAKGRHREPSQRGAGTKVILVTQNMRNALTTVSKKETKCEPLENAYMVAAARTQSGVWILSKGPLEPGLKQRT